MIILRLISLIFLAAGLMTLGADAISSLETPGDAFIIRSLDQVLTLLHASPKAWLDATLPASVAGVLAVALSWPCWAVTGVLGIILSLIAGRTD